MVINPSVSTSIINPSSYCVSEDIPYSDSSAVCKNLQNALGYFSTSTETCHFLKTAVISVQYCLHSIETYNTSPRFVKLLNIIEGCTISPIPTVSVCNTFPKYDIPTISNEGSNCYIPVESFDTCITLCMSAIPDIIRVGSIDKTRNKDFCSISLCSKCASSFDWIQQMVGVDLANYLSGYSSPSYSTENSATTSTTDSLSPVATPTPTESLTTSEILSQFTSMLYSSVLYENDSEAALQLLEKISDMIANAVGPKIDAILKKLSYMFKKKDQLLIQVYLMPLASFMMNFQPGWKLLNIKAFPIL